jgi:DNA-binding beta-propeller fold protein YncE
LLVDPFAGRGVVVGEGRAVRRYLLVAAVMAAVTVAGPIAGDSVPAGAAVQGGRATPGTRLWTAQFEAGASTLSEDMVVSPHGGTVFVTGESHFKAGAGFQTVAYRAKTGSQLWISRYHSAANGQNEPDAIAVSPNGAAVFVTGSVPRRGQDYEYATVAYRAATGKQLWVRTYNGPGDGYDFGNAVTVSPDAKIVFVTGMSYHGVTSDYATIAYSAATGRQLWVSRYHGPGNVLSGARTLAVSPDGDRVFVTGSNDSNQVDDSFVATVAYSAATGKQLWVSRYHGPGKGINGAGTVAVNPDGTTVFVNGQSSGHKTGDFITLAYNAATGKQLWADRYHGAGKGYTFDSAMALSPAGTTVFVTGDTNGNKNGNDFVTMAYGAATGKQLWARQYHGYEAQSVAVNPCGTAVYVTGYGYRDAGYATVAYSAAAGKRLWAAGYGHAANSGADVIAASPDGTAVFVTGFAQAGGEYLTIAYRS